LPDDILLIRLLLPQPGDYGRLSSMFLVGRLKQETKFLPLAIAGPGLMVSV
jgi:hypothetical protein